MLEKSIKRLHAECLNLRNLDRILASEEMKAVLRTVTGARRRRIIEAIDARDKTALLHYARINDTPLMDMNLRTLRKLASQYGIAHYCGKTKEELARRIEDAQQK